MRVGYRARFMQLTDSFKTAVPPHIRARFVFLEVRNAASAVHRTKVLVKSMVETTGIEPAWSAFARASGAISSSP